MRPYPRWKKHSTPSPAPRPPRAKCLSKLPLDYQGSAPRPASKVDFSNNARGSSAGPICAHPSPRGGLSRVWGAQARRANTMRAWARAARALACITAPCRRVQGSKRAVVKGGALPPATGGPFWATRPAKPSEKSLVRVCPCPVSDTRQPKSLTRKIPGIFKNTSTSEGHPRVRKGRQAGRAPAGCVRLGPPPAMRTARDAHTYEPL